ncbi:MAG: hypothetical protein M3R04_03405 [bacterium]|nr:hypothetical protein [bacterium]
MRILINNHHSRHLALLVGLLIVISATVRPLECSGAEPKELVSGFGDWAFGISFETVAKEFSEPAADDILPGIYRAKRNEDLPLTFGNQTLLFEVNLDLSHQENVFVINGISLKNKGLNGLDLLGGLDFVNQLHMNLLSNYRLKKFDEVRDDFDLDNLTWYFSATDTGQCSIMALVLDGTIILTYRDALMNEKLSGVAQPDGSKL